MCECVQILSESCFQCVSRRPISVIRFGSQTRMTQRKIFSALSVSQPSGPVRLAPPLTPRGLDDPTNLVTYKRTVSLGLVWKLVVAVWLQAVLQAERNRSADRFGTGCVPVPVVLHKKHPSACT